MNVRSARSLLVAALTAAVLVAVPSSASAAPKITSVEGAWTGADATADYVVFVVKSKGAKKVKLKWPGNGGATAKVKDGLTTLVFAGDGATRYKVTAQAAKGKKWSKAKKFSGSFVPAVPVEVPGAPPLTVTDDAAGVATQAQGPLLNDIFPEIPDVVPPIGSITLPPLPVPLTISPPVPQLDNLDEYLTDPPA